MYHQFSIPSLRINCIIGLVLCSFVRFLLLDKLFVCLFSGIVCLFVFYVFFVGGGSSFLRSCIVIIDFVRDLFNITVGKGIAQKKNVNPGF